MARYKKKRARELQHDRFRDTTMGIFDRLGNLLEGKGRTILYVIGGAIIVAALLGGYALWSRRKSDEARRAMGRAIAIAATPVMSTSIPGFSQGATFPSEQERARKAIDEFEKVAAKYGDPYRSEARYFIATNQLYVERDKGLTELAQLSSSSIAEVAVLSKFALAQAKEADTKYDEAAALYGQLAALNSPLISAEVANFRLAMVYQKQGKNKEAADILFPLADAARKAKYKDGTPIPLSEAARNAAEQLQKLDPERFTQLTPESPGLDL